MAFKKNQCVTVEINDITDLGFGVGRVDGAVVFVSDTVPGDICEVKLITRYGEQCSACHIIAYA